MIDKKQIITFIILFIVLAGGLFAGVNLVKEKFNNSQKTEISQESTEQTQSQENEKENTSSTEVGNDEEIASAQEEIPQENKDVQEEVSQDSPGDIPQTGAATDLLLIFTIMLTTFFIAKYINSKRYLKIN